MSDYKDTIALAVIALITALNLGILNYYKTANTISLQPILIIMIKILIAIILIIFLFYLIILCISKIYRRPILKDMHPIIYDIGLAITIIIVGITITLGLKVSFKNPSYIIYSNIIVAVLTGIIIFKKLVDEYKEHAKN